MNQKLKNSKKIYDSIEIPPELNTIVAKSIDIQPRQTVTSSLVNKQPGRGARRSKTIKYMAVVAASLLVCTTLGINSLSANSDKISNIPLIEYLVNILNAGNNHNLQLIVNQDSDSSEDIISSNFDSENVDNTPSVKMITNGKSEAASDDSQNLYTANLSVTEDLASSSESDDNFTLGEIVNSDALGNHSVISDRTILACKDGSLDTRAEIAIGMFVKDAVTRGSDYRKPLADTSYFIKYRNGSVLSVAIIVEGSAESHNYGAYYYNVDLDEKRSLTLAEVLGAGYIPRANNAIVSQINARLNSDSSVVYWGYGDNDEADSSKGFFTVNADSVFYINKYGNPVICFEAGTIAPAYMGVQEFEIAN